MASKQGDPYKAPDNSPDLETTVKDLISILDGVTVSLLTTRAHDSDSLHTRAMYPYSHKGLKFSYLGNNESGKYAGIEKDSSVNVGFYDSSNSSWVSVAGKATISNDRERIKEAFSPQFRAWFADMKDGVHTGDGNDPRITIIDVEPVEIRYYIEQKTTIGKMIDIAQAIVSDDTAKPGSLRVLTGSELEQAKKIAE